MTNVGVHTSSILNRELKHLAVGPRDLFLYRLEKGTLLQLTTGVTERERCGGLHVLRT